MNSIFKSTTHFGLDPSRSTRGTLTRQSGLVQARADELAEPKPSITTSRRVKFKRACLCVLLTTSATMLSLGLCVKREPTFEGKTLYRWSRDLTASYGRIDRDQFRKLGPGIVPHLIHEIERYYDPFDRNLDFKVANALWLLAPECVRSYLPPAVHQADRRTHAIQLLSELGPEGRSAVPVLIWLLDDEEVNTTVVLALKGIGREARAAVPKLIELLAEEQPMVATTLAKIADDPRDVAPALARALATGPDWLRREAAKALETMNLSKVDDLLLQPNVNVCPQPTPGRAHRHKVAPSRAKPESLVFLRAERRP